MMPVETISRIGENKGEWWRGLIKYDIFDIL
jgi:hypothetical protein